MLRWLVAVLVGMFLVAPSSAQDWPAKPIRLIVPGGLDSTEDSLASMITRGFAENSDYRIVLASYPGDRGVPATREIASSAPDGYTFGITSLSSLALAPSINARNAYHPLNDLTHVAFIAAVPMVLAIPGYVGNLETFIAGAGKSDKPPTFTSPGVGSPGHLIGEAIAASTKVRVEHIPYPNRRAEQILNEVVGRQHAFAISPLRPVTPFIHARTLTGIAVTSSERMPLAYRDIPTFKELGHAGLVMSNWYVISGPAKLPKEIVDKFSRDVAAILAKTASRIQIRRDEFQTEAMSPGAVTAFVAAERERWAALIKRVGLLGEGVRD
jgi:tripartite-type tricarboxylate transporter receptor subunit TctC